MKGEVMKVMSRVKGFIAILMGVLLTAGIAFSAAPPRVTVLPNVKIGGAMVTSPTSLAISSGGSLYIVEGSKGRTAIYSRTGELLGFIPEGNASDIAIDANGSLFIADRGARAVKKYVGAALVATADGFTSVRGIGVDKVSGNVYVVDGGGLAASTASVRIFANDLSSPASGMTSIDEAGNFPWDVAVGETEVYIIEKASSLARLRIVDKSTGSMKAVSGAFGVGFGQMLFPSSVSIDSSARAYVTDSGNNKVVVFDSAGAVLSEIKINNGNALYQADGIGMTPEGRLLVVSQTEQSVYQFGIDSFAYLGVSPKSLSFDGAMVGGQSVSVSNMGTAGFSYTASADAPWIRLSGTSGTVNGGASTTVAVSANTAGMAAGQYSGTITVLSSLGEAETVSVSLSVADPAARPSAAPAPVGEPAAPPAAKSLQASVIAGVASAAQATEVRLFDNSMAVAAAFQPFGASFASTVAVAAGDFDGDGVDEIVAGYSSGDAVSRLAIFRRDGAMLPLSDFAPFGAGAGSSVRVAVADLDGDGNPEIIVGAGVGSATSEVRVFSFGETGITDSGISVNPFITGNGVTVAAGDMDKDGIAEFVVAPGPDAAAAGVIKIFKADSRMGLGAWRAVEVGGFTAFADTYGVNVAVADIDADGNGDLLVAAGTSSANAVSRFAAYRPDGSKLGVDVVEAAQGGIEIAAGDTDGDGVAEIVTLTASADSNSVILKTYKNGIVQTSTEILSTTLQGARVSLGRTGY